jgi:endonuclease G
MDDIRLKTDPEQLEGILEQFPDSAIIEALKHKGLLKPEKGKIHDGFHDGAHCRKTIDDFKDPGVEAKIGKESRCELSDLPILEAQIGVSNFLPAHFLEEGAVVQRAVARVTLIQDHLTLDAGDGWATGFMVSPTLFLTNHHVIPDKAFANKIEMQFNYQLDYSGAAQTVDAFMPAPADPAFHTNSALDYTLIRMKPKRRFWYPMATNAATMAAPEIETMEGNGEATIGGTAQLLAGTRTFQRAGMADLAINPFWWRYLVRAGDVWSYLPLRDGFGLAIDEHLNIVQHPRGRRKEVALQENMITNIYTNHLRYTTDTEPGSSGSPVLNNGWDVIALHHAAGEKDAADNWIKNQGIRIDKIVADLRTHFGGISGGTAILNELGL